MTIQVPVAKSVDKKRTTKKCSTKQTHCHTVTHRYSTFKNLWKQLILINKECSEKKELHGSVNFEDIEEKPYENFIDCISAEFPLGVKTYFGISLSDSEVSERTRMLDHWFRDLCYHYRRFPPGTLLINLNAYNQSLS